MIRQPKVAVYLAAFNGKEYIRRQIQSIFDQNGVDVTVFVSVDLSTDGTEDLVDQMSFDDQRIKILPHGHTFGNAGRNFYRLICEVDLSNFDYVAFADQDDIWNVNKLTSHCALLEAHRSEAVSSNVTAFWPDGRQKLIIKSQPQHVYDFLFESAGPGCTFLMTPWLVAEVKHQLLNNEAAQEIVMHDWLTYAICRAHGKPWLIDSEPSVRYRQHQHNLVGANSGLKALFTRFKKINDGWYRYQVELIARVALSINPDKKLSSFQKNVQEDSIVSRLRLMPFVIRGRRKFVDRLFLMCAILFFRYRASAVQQVFSFTINTYAIRSS